MANYACLKCGHVLEVPAPYVHRQVRCPKCSERFVPAKSITPVSSSAQTPNENTEDVGIFKKVAGQLAFGLGSIFGAMQKLKKSASNPQAAFVRANNKRWDAILWGLVIVTAAIVTWAFAGYGTPLMDQWGVGYISPFLFVLVPAISAIFAFALFGHWQCPSCRRLWTRSEVGAEELARAEGYETVYRKDEIRGNDGSHHGYIDRKEQIRVARVRVRTYCVCSACAFEWHVDSNQTIR